MENNETIEDVKTDILEELSKTQNMNIEEREQLLKLETNKKNKLNLRSGNIALDQIIKDIRLTDITTLNELTCLTAKAIVERCGMKINNRDRISHKKPAWKCKIQKEMFLEVNYLYWKIYQKGSL